MMVALLAAGATVGSPLVGAVGAEETIAEPVSGVRCDAARSIDGRQLFLVGTGLRRQQEGKLYAMALYVDEAEARRNFPALITRAGGKDHVRLHAADHAQAFVAWGQFTKVAVLKFARAVPAAEVRAGFKESLDEILSDKSPDELRRAGEQFIGLFDRDLTDGEEVVLKTTGEGKIEVEVGGERRSAPQSPKLARAIWNIWLGAHPVSKEMRASLVERIDLLGK
jgi:hypothetical protein